ncbi:hypothetical protein AV530_012654 [Patagioenas fasciata monilis]|uniref:Uncharacterized protein n=1 Tax=Patagioenas fasciata monilis TaxID=372326 RepID=A0A1V4JBU9_PATFA|nr:hypothetical protein AV530_012654 [Patagioenas fasciata monilis]
MEVTSERGLPLGIRRPTLNSVRILEGFIRRGSAKKNRPVSYTVQVMVFAKCMNYSKGNCLLFFYRVKKLGQRNCFPISAVQLYHYSLGYIILFHYYFNT